jgi:hypothetical protein
MCYFSHPTKLQTDEIEYVEHVTRVHNFQSRAHYRRYTFGGPGSCH